GGQAALRTLGLHVSPARDGAAAMELAAREDFDMAIIGAGMAGDGAANLVSRLRAGTSTPSILVLAAPAEVRRATQALAQGTDDYVLRPLDAGEVRTRGGRLLIWQPPGDRAL